MERLGEETHETVHLSVTRGEQVVQVAQVDSRFLLGTRDWTEVEVPAAHLGARQGLLRLGRAARADRRARAAHRRHHRRPRRAAPRRRPHPQARLGRHPRRARGRADRRRRTRPRTARRRGRRPRHLGTHRSDWRTGSTSSAAACRPTPRSSPGCCAAAPRTTTPPRRRASHDHTRRDPAGSLRRDAGRQRTARPRAHRGGAGARHGAADPALRRADPLARGGRRPLRARRLLRARRC